MAGKAIRVLGRAANKHAAPLHALLHSIHPRSATARPHGVLATELACQAHAPAERVDVLGGVPLQRVGGRQILAQSCPLPDLPHQDRMVQHLVGEAAPKYVRRAIPMPRLELPPQ
jgi:hypothetical protein